MSGTLRNIRNIAPPQHSLRGVVEQVDLIGRAIQLRTNDAEMRIHVPPTCEILVNADRVRFHFLQPTDRIKVVVEEDRGGPLARRIEFDRQA
ncbi:MAG: hypothetical protein KF708_24135 [Pirellulales bacterium]|nr:hypothetical protein [Pirellulales bacterium]